MDGYIIKRVGSSVRPEPVNEKAARRVLAERLELIDPKYHLRYPPKDLTWGPEKTRPEAIDTAFHNTQKIGQKAHIRGSHEDGPKIALIHTFSSLGSDVVKIALDQLGDEYTWASAGPSAFDCSGLIIYCYQRVGTYFPLHSADDIMKSNQVHTFNERAKVRDGDLIGYHVGRLPAGQYDHIGIACWRNDNLCVIDASSSADQVVFRDADSNPVVNYGYVTDVTGAH